MVADTLDLAVRGGTVVSSTGRMQADIGIRDGLIAVVGEAGPADQTIDATGCFVLPGAIDVHTHLQLPTNDYPERFFHDTRAALVGGTTTVLSFAEQPRGGSLVHTLRQWQEDTPAEAASDYGFHLIITDLNDRTAKEIPTVIAEGCPTFKGFMVYKELMIPDRDLLRAFRITSVHRGMMMVHCENEVLLNDLVESHLRDKHTAPRYHEASRPTILESEATYRALCMAKVVEAPFYIVHLSCGDALEHLRAARQAGQRVYAETCPHYLTLTKESYQGSDESCARFVISPPLREASDSSQLWSALAGGDLDVVGSDHVPRRISQEKENPPSSFADIPNGAPGIETLPSLVFSQGVSRDRISIERFVDLLSTTPARLFGLTSKGSIEVGKDADVVLWNPESTRTISQDTLHHSADFTPYEGMQLTGVVEKTILRGKLVAERGKYLGQRGDGQFQYRSLSNGSHQS